jgi:MarR family transcriptional regulator for hemolysin
MGPPSTEPIGLQLIRTAKTLSRAFDEALGEVGGTLPTWQILVSLKAQRHGAQRQIAAAVGVEGPTLTHHLNRLEREGLVERSRDPANRRVHRVQLTQAGEAAFSAMLGAVQAFDRTLRSALTEQQLTDLESALGALRHTVQRNPALSNDAVLE